MLTRKCATLCLLWPLLQTGLVLASESCVYCRGINCQRSSYAATEHCLDKLDVCVSVFQEGRVQAQGCFDSLEDNWRQHCEGPPSPRAQCEICVTEKCNNVSSRQFSCLQCEDTEDERCRSAPQELTPQSCAIARSGRNLCYARAEGERIERGCSLTLSEQTSCLSDVNCRLCDPTQIADCNDQLLEASTVTTETPVSSTTSSSTSSSSSSTSESPSTSTSSSTSSSSSSSTSSSTSSSSSTSTSSSTSPSPSASTTTEEPSSPTTAKPNGAASLCMKNLPALLFLSQLLRLLYGANK
ncbi:hypothetical protein KR222_007609 [Zaprionus bogoriensis]|nr:hypothetical protein KR222_007609 [Zaprionus bogoriensis]